MRRPDFSNCYDNGRRFFSRHFVIFVRQREENDMPWRVGLSVSKKVGVAVARNRVKRVLREFFRLYHQIITEAVDIVVIPKRSLQPMRLTLGMAAGELVPVLTQALRIAIMPLSEVSACEQKK